MYIPDFVVGFVSCILLELAILICYCFYDTWKKGKK